MARNAGFRKRDRFRVFVPGLPLVYNDAATAMMPRSADSSANTYLVPCQGTHDCDANGTK